MVFLWRRRVFGPPFARGMARLLEVGEQALDRLLVGLVDRRGLAEPALLLAGLTGQDVTEVAAPPLHLARGGHLEALRRAPARLDLRHHRPFLLADQHYRHATAFHARLLLDAGHVGHLLGDPVEHRLAELGVRDRAPAEEDRHLDAVAVGQEAADLPVDPCLLLDLGYGTPPGMRAWAAVAATNASTAIVCGAPPVRGATVPAAASRSPTTATTGTFSSSASRTL